MATEIHKHTARLIWQGHSTLDIVSELQHKFDLSDRPEVENELFAKVGQLRNLIKEARELAPGVATQMFRDGYNRAEVSRRLEAPFLISGFEIDGIVGRALAAFKAEQE